MGLFGFGKNKNEITTSCCCSCSASVAPQPVSECCGKEINGICCIKVIGAGCKSCHDQYNNVKTAVNNLGLSIEVEYITDIAKVMEYGVMSMPAIVVNEKVVSVGKVLSEKEITKILGGIING
ncbi:MAG: thioredoxin family protein [Schaedlerella sp.]|nr:thioredoxin family protein [Schaedlerella sp.]